MQSRPFPEESSPMPTTFLPCYGGPKDGTHFPENHLPIGYKIFPIRGRKVYLWKTIKVERLDFGVLSRASKAIPPGMEETDEETKTEET